MEGRMLMLYLKNVHALQYHRTYKTQLLRYALRRRFNVSVGYSVTKYIIL